MLYRRAEGLRYNLRACDPDQVAFEVPHRGAESILGRDEARLLGRLHEWRTPEELNVPESELKFLVLRDLAYFCDGEKPRHVLGATPLPSREGFVALRPNLRMHVLFGRRGEPVQRLPFMPRNGLLDRAELAGLLFGVLEHDEETALVKLSCCSAHAMALRVLLPRLDGRHRWSELAVGPAAQVLEVLDLAGLLEEFHPPEWPTSSAQVTWIGHAGVLYEAGGQRLLVDPLFHACPLPPRPRIGGAMPQPFDMRRIGPVDGILITHGDNDHLHAESLLRFTTHTPIYLPSNTRRMAYQVDLEGVARLCGFRNVHLLDEWQRTRAGDVEIVAVPFRGEDWGLDLPKRTWLMKHPSLTVYCSADSAYMPEVYQQLAAENIDVAFLGVAGCAEPHVTPRELGYGHFYLEWIPVEKANQWIQHTCGPEESAAAAKRMGARHAFGYAAGTGYMTMGYSDRGTPADLVEALRGSEVNPIAMPLGQPISWPPSG